MGVLRWVEQSAVATARGDLAYLINDSSAEKLRPHVGGAAHKSPCLRRNLPSEKSKKKILGMRSKQADAYIG